VLRQGHALRKIGEDEFGSLGDTSTLAEPAGVNDLIDNRQSRRPHSAASVATITGSGLTLSAGMPSVSRWVFQAL
jgi:hypothetical protein